MHLRAHSSTQHNSGILHARGQLSNEGLPQVFSVSYLDAVGAIGYAREVSEDLSVGANLKALHRRLANKNVDAENLGHVFEEAREDLDEYVTGVTADIGGLYSHEPTGTDIGLVVQNLIPVQKIKSTSRFRFVTSEQYYLTERLSSYLQGRPLEGTSQEPYVGYYNEDEDEWYLHPDADALLYVESQVQNQYLPIELQAPLLLNLGVLHPIDGNWDVAVDWVDILSQDSRFGSYTERFRIGTEYRLMANALALRAGVADQRFTGGFGVNFRVLQFDAAYAYDNYVEDNSYFLQLKLGW